MSTFRELTHRDENLSHLVVLTVYAKADVAVCGRILQRLSLHRVVVERIVADFSRFDHRGIRGLEGIESPPVRISVAASIADHHQLERITKALNKLVDVYKIQHTFRL